MKLYELRYLGKDFNFSKNTNKYFDNSAFPLTEALKNNFIAISFLNVIKDDFHKLLYL